MHHRY